MTIDGYPVQCTYRDPLIHVVDPPTLDPEWVESHCMISKYCLQIAKCDDANCCAPPRSDIKELIGGRFLPGPLLMKSNPQSTSSLGLCDNLTLERRLSKIREYIQDLHKRCHSHISNLRAISWFTYHMICIAPQYKAS